MLYAAIVCVFVGTSFAVRSLVRRKLTRAWLIALALACVAGLFVGIWSSFRFERQMTATMRTTGYPIDLTLTRTQQAQNAEQTIVYPRKPPMRQLAIAVNATFFACVAVLVVWVANTLAKRATTQQRPAPRSD